VRRPRSDDRMGIHHVVGIRPVVDIRHAVGIPRAAGGGRTPGRAGARRTDGGNPRARPGVAGMRCHPRGSRRTGVGARRTPAVR